MLGDKSMSISLKLAKIVRFNISLTTLTGLLISAGKTLGRIGGADVEPMSIEKEYGCDKDIVKVRVPYIPGSSLKGRIRSLLEMSLGLPLYSSDGKIWSHTLSRSVTVDLNGNKITTKDFVQTLTSTDLDLMFGYGAFPINEVVDDLKKEGAKNLIDKLVSTITPTSLLVEDLFPDKDLVCRTYRENAIVTFEDFLEDKNENRIDRVTSSADPRTISRVKPGITFNGNMSLLVYNKSVDKAQKYLELLIDGMKLLELTYLGASGSRGYGRVKFTQIKVSVYDTQTNTENEIGSYGSVDELRKDMQKLTNDIGGKK